MNKIFEWIGKATLVAVLVGAAYYSYQHSSEWFKTKEEMIWVINALDMGDYAVVDYYDENTCFLKTERIDVRPYKLQKGDIIMVHKNFFDNYRTGYKWGEFDMEKHMKDIRKKKENGY